MHSNKSHNDDMAQLQTKLCLTKVLLLDPLPAMENQADIRDLLCRFQMELLQAILAGRAERSIDALSSVTKETAADTIYAIDQVAETTIVDWFGSNWPADWPVELVMEGIEEASPLAFPPGTAVGDTRFKCIIDPIDGTRGFMYDKRAAWILTGIAPQRGPANTLEDIEVSVMTELPTSRQWRADQTSAIRRGGVRTEAIDVRNGFSRELIVLQPSTAVEVRHAFGTVSRFFPAGLTLLSTVEEALWERLYGRPKQVDSNSKGRDCSPSPLVFNDQYISSGGQFYEILAGHDLFIADLRPEAFQKLSIPDNLASHPYDVCTALILQEAGCVVEQPDGSPLDCPLDTTTPVSWVAYANHELASAIRPALQAVIEELL